MSKLHEGNNHLLICFVRFRVYKESLLTEKISYFFSAFMYWQFEAEIYHNGIWDTKSTGSHIYGTTHVPKSSIVLYTFQLYTS